MLRVLSMLGLCIIMTRDICALPSNQLSLGGAFKVCSRSDPRLEQCIVDSLNGAKEKLAAGIPELGLPSLVPLHGDRMSIREGEEELNLQLTFSNFTWSGIPNYVATKAKMDFSRKYLEVEMMMNQMQLLGQYVLRGLILTLRIEGNGLGEINWNSNITHQFTFEEEMRGDQKYWKVKDYKWKMDLTSFHCNFRNLFRGNKRLGIYSNRFLNRNWKPAYLIYGYLIEDGLGDVIKRLIINKFMERVPLSQMFSP